VKVTKTPAEARLFLLAAESEAQFIVDHDWGHIEALAGELALRGRLDANDITAIISLGPRKRLLLEGPSQEGYERDL
jgi:hypothetical protein